MSSRTDSKALTALAVPIALTQLAQVALTTADTVMMGMIGTQALASGGLAIVLFNQVRTMGVGMVTAVGNQVAAARAREDADDIKAVVRAGLLLATLTGLLGAALLVGIGQALPLVGQDPDVADRASAMLAALAPGLLPCLWFQVLRQFTVGMRRPLALVWITVVSIAVNVGLNWVFITGTWGLPKLGLTGIGLATTVVHTLSFAALYVMTRRDPELGDMVTLRAWRAPAAKVRTLTRLGLPIAATYGSEAGFFSVAALLIGSYGAPALAAHTAVNQLIYIVFQVTVGLSHAASISVSGDIAVGEFGKARRISRVALLHGFVVMGVVGCVYLTAPSLVLSPFFAASDSAAAAVARDLLLVAVVLQFFDCAQNIGVGLLRGLDDTKAGLRMTLIGYWLVGLPAGLLLGTAVGWGAVGVWLGLLIGLATTAVLLLRRYHQSLTANAAVAV